MAMLLFVKALVKVLDTIMLLILRVIVMATTILVMKTACCIHFIWSNNSQCCHSPLLPRGNLNVVPCSLTTQHDLRSRATSNLAGIHRNHHNSKLVDSAHHPSNFWFLHTKEKVPEHTCLTSPAREKLLPISFRTYQSFPTAVCMHLRAWCHVAPKCFLAESVVICTTTVCIAGV